MKNKYKKLLNNSVIFAIGNFGSKIMQFILIPIYSYALTTTEFGKVDVLTSLVSLLAPIICLDIFDGVFRFALDKTENKVKLFSTGIIFTLFSSIVICIVTLVLAPIISTYPVIYTGILLIVTIFYSLITNYARAVGFVKQYAISGIINTIVMGLSNILLLVYLHAGMNGYMLSMIAGQIVAILFLFIFTNIVKDIKLKSFDFFDLKRVLRYSIPLIPNNLAWWLNSTSDRFFILGMLGASYNGIYAMASKIPSLITTITSIFFQSWQISVVEEFNSKESKKFISQVFEGFVSVLFCGTFIILGAIKLIFKLFLNPSYYSGWMISPYLLLAVVYTSIASFLGTIYTANKRTEKVMITTIYGGVVNVVLTIIFIKMMGLGGAALANAISFLLVSFLRYKDIHNIGKIELDYRNFAILHVLFAVECFLLFVVNNSLVMTVIGALMAIIQFCANKTMRSMVILFGKKGYSKFKNILNK